MESVVGAGGDGLVFAVAGLVLLGAALLVATVATARPPAGSVPDLDGYFDRWVGLHGGYDPRTGSRFLRGWLVLTFAAGRRLARRGILANAITAWTLWLALAAVTAAAVGGRWSLVAGALLVASGFGDTLDGCVAVLTGRATRWGYVVDSVVDRVNDLLYLAAVVAVGASVWLAVATGFGLVLLEYIRARGANAGAGDLGTVTVGERASRVILCALALFAAGVAPERGAVVATGGLVTLAVLTGIGIGQLVVAVRCILTAAE